MSLGGIHCKKRAVSLISETRFLGADGGPEEKDKVFRKRHFLFETIIPTPKNYPCTNEAEYRVVENDEISSNSILFLALYCTHCNRYICKYEGRDSEVQKSSSEHTIHMTLSMKL